MHRHGPLDRGVYRRRLRGRQGTGEGGQANGGRGEPAGDATESTVHRHRRGLRRSRSKGRHTVENHGCGNLARSCGRCQGPSGFLGDAIRPAPRRTEDAWPISVDVAPPSRVPSRRGRFCLRFPAFAIVPQRPGTDDSISEECDEYANAKDCSRHACSRRSSCCLYRE